MTPPAAGGSPLSDKRVLVTRQADRAGPWLEALRRAGARAACLPVLRTEAIPTPAPERLRSACEEADWLVFTSAEAVRQLARRIELRGIRTPVACVGKTTVGAAEEVGLRVQRVPEERQDATSLAALLVDRETLSGARVLFPCAEGARDVLPRALEAVGARVERLPLYRTLAADFDAEAVTRELGERRVDVLVFASPSAVRALYRSLSEHGRVVARRTLNAALGPATAEELRKWGGSADIVPERPDVSHLIAALEAHFAAASRPPEEGA